MRRTGNSTAESRLRGGRASRPPGRLAAARLARDLSPRGNLGVHGGHRPPAPGSYAAAARARQADRPPAGRRRDLGRHGAGGVGRSGRIADHGQPRSDPASGRRLAQAARALPGARATRAEDVAGCLLPADAQAASALVGLLTGPRGFLGVLILIATPGERFHAGARGLGGDAAGTLHRGPGKRSASAGNGRPPRGGRSRQGIAAASLGPQRSRRDRGRRRQRACAR